MASKQSFSIVQLMMGVAIIVTCVAATISLATARRVEKTLDHLDVVIDPPYYIDEGVSKFATTAKTEIALERYTYVVEEVMTNKKIVNINRPVYVVANEINEHKDMELISASFNPHVPGRILLVFRKKD